VTAPTSEFEFKNLVWFSIKSGQILSSSCITKTYSVLTSAMALLKFQMKDCVTSELTHRTPSFKKTSTASKTSFLLPLSKIIISFGVDVCFKTDVTASIK